MLLCLEVNVFDFNIKTTIPPLTRTKKNISIQLFYIKAPWDIIYIFKPFMLFYGILLKTVNTQIHQGFFIIIIISAGNSHK